MGINIKLGKTNYFPIYLLWLASNIGPLAFIVTRFVNLSEWKLYINELAFIIISYISVYAINYLIATYYFDFGESHLKSEVKQTLLNFFAIIRSAIVLVVIGVLIYFFTQSPETIVIVTIGLEVVIFIYHFVKKRSNSKNDQNR
jgi:uncharacterized membrane protein YesL